MGMQPAGEAFQDLKKLDGRATQQAEPHDKSDMTTRQAMRTRIFWMLVVSMLARSAAFTTVTTHFIPIMVWKGLSQTQASVLLAGFAIFNLPLHFVLGWIGDFVNKPKLTAICMLLGIVALLPMLGLLVDQPFFNQRILHCPRCFPDRDTGAVGDAEDVRVDGYCRLSEDCV